MNRREFLTRTTGGAAVAAGLGVTSFAQARQGAAPGRGGAAGGRGGGPANVPAEKLARVSLMTLDFNSIIKQPGRNASPQQTVEVLDLPQYYVDHYGVPNIEFQHGHLIQAETDPAFIKDMKTRLDERKMRMQQINLEFGQENISNPDAALRQRAVDHTKQWIDIAAQFECPKVMLNQGQLTEESKTNAIAAWKQMADYGRLKNVKVSAEPRGGGGARGGAAPAAPAAWPPAWFVLLMDTIKASGGYSNLDIGNVGAMSQQQMHDVIKMSLPLTSGQTHIKVSPNWDLGTAVRYMESLGYKGLYTIEVNTDPAVRIVYDVILANI